MTMPESQPQPDKKVSIAVERRIRWDALAAIIASLVGLLALVVAGYTAHIQNEQVRAQVWPFLQGAYSGGRTELMWVNKGVGPAIVHNVEVTIGGKPQNNWNAVVRSLGVPQIPFDPSFLNSNVLSPGETVDWIKFHNASDYGSFRLAMKHVHMDVAVCYCSTLGDCWQTHFTGANRYVGVCPAIPASRQFND